MKYIVNICADGHGDAVVFDNASDAAAWLQQWAGGLAAEDFEENRFVIELGAE